MTNAVNIAQSGSNNQTMRNRIINGAMTIDQRNAGASVTISDSTKQYTTDRWSAFETTDGIITVQQVSDAPAGFINSARITTTTADSSLSANQRCQFTQDIEGFNIADLAWGTANAQPVTLSFWVKSSLTGTFGGSLANSAADRSYVFTYSISSANTWEQKSVTISGDTTGTWLTNNGIGIRLYFGLGVGTDFQRTAGSWAGAFGIATSGSVSVIGTLNATWQITGVQLEEGTAASPFENRLIGTELQLCQRYAQKNTSSIGEAGGSTEGAFYFPYQVSMRAAPTATLLVGTNMIDDIYVSQKTISSVGALFGPAGIDRTNGVAIILGSSSLTPGNMLAVFPGALLFSAEL
jgi:hypothetical protein